MIGGQTVPTHTMSKQLPLSQDGLCTRQSPVVCFTHLSGLLRRLRLAMIDRHVSLFHAPQKKRSSSAGSRAVTLREGPRPIRTRQRAERAARRAAQLPEHTASRSAAQPGAGDRAVASPLPSACRSAAQLAAATHLSSAPQPRSAALQDLETAVSRSRHGLSDCRGLGSGPTALAAASHRVAFVAALAPSPPEDMDCTPPVAWRRLGEGCTRSQLWPCLPRDRLPTWTSMLCSSQPHHHHHSPCRWSSCRWHWMSGMSSWSGWTPTQLSACSTGELP